MLNKLYADSQNR